MKTVLLSILVLLLAGCSLSATNPPIANQSQDLNDSDGDGVINARDLCYATPTGAVVNNDGCPILNIDTEQNKLHILFSNDSDHIPQSFIAQIQSMSDFLAKYPSTYITLKGYASPVGKADYNLDLSKRRAEQVRQKLLTAGVKDNRIEILGFGDSEPVKADDKKTVNILSRRVTATVEGMNADVKESWTIFDQRAQ